MLPASGTVGDQITVNGTGLVGVDTVIFTDSAAATATAVFTPVSDTQLVATVPGGLATGAGKVTPPDSAENGPRCRLLPAHQAAPSAPGKLGRPAKAWEPTCSSKVLWAAASHVGQVNVGIRAVAFVDGAGGTRVPTTLLNPRVVRRW